MTAIRKANRQVDRAQLPDSPSRDWPGSFEHAWFLLPALGRSDEIALKGRAECGGVRLHDLLAKRGSACLTCPPGSELSG